MKRLALPLLVAGLLASPLLFNPMPAQAGVSIGISVGIAPPPLPVYEQPMIPGPGYMWTPGYWAWNPGYGYYWVPGTWVMPPQIGLLWTPGWWGWSGGFYRWNAGYWGTHIGFYGGVNYGFGYFGSGYAGGYWRGNNFFYNRAVNNINITNVRNVYVDKTVINNYHGANASRVSYNGGRGGLRAEPSVEQRRFATQQRIAPTRMQTQQRDVAMRNPSQRFNENRGRPAVFATQHAGRFDGSHAVRTPSPNRNSMVAAPERARPAAGPQRNNRMMEAPRNRPQTMQSSRNNRPTAQTDRERGFVEAPRNRPQPMQQSREQFQRGPAANRGAAPELRAERQQQSRGEPRQQPRNAKPEERGHAEHKRGDDNGHGRRN